PSRVSPSPASVTDRPLAPRHGRRVVELPPLRGTHPPERGDVSGLPASPPIRRRRRRPAGSRGGGPAGRGRDHPPPRERGAVGVLGDDRGPRRAGGNGGPPGGGRGRAPPERGPAVHAPCGGPGSRVLEAGRLLRSTMIRCRGVVRAARIAVAVTSV